MLAALAFLTPLPVGARRPGAGTLAWLPVAGAVVGAVVAGAWVLAAEVWPPLLAAAVVVAADLLVTGALHVDGLADTADGVLPHLEGPDRRRAVMAAPDVGAFGVAAVVAALLLRTGALAAIGAVDAAPVSLVALWALARGAMAVSLVVVPYVGGGLASAFLGARRPVVLAAAVVVPLGIAVVSEDVASTSIALVAGSAAAAGVVSLARRRLGGVTGDVLGAAGVVAETAGLLVLAGVVVIPPTRDRLAGAALGIAVDRFAGEPPARVPHPVALLGRALGGLEGRTYRDDRAAGVVHAAAGVALGMAGGTAMRSTAAATATCVAGRMLGDVALAIGAQLAAGDLEGARRDLRALAGRDASALDEPGVARAVVESVAENTVDAVVAPALWAAALGPAGAGAHKAASTLDSMVGHRSERYERFGWASARLDDAMAWVPARATAALVATARPRRAGAVLAAVRRDAPAHPSPNAGVAEAAFAAALGVQLGGPLAYAGRVEHRALLGSGPAPSGADIARAVRLSRDVSWVLAGWLGAAAGLAAVGGRRRRSAMLSGDA